MKFDQVKISETLEPFFGENFRSKWNLKKYKNPNKPTIFLGLYSKNDLEDFKNHKSTSIVIWGGADIKSKTLSEVRNSILYGKCYTFAYPGEFSKLLTEEDIPHKTLHLEIKDYSNFKPTPLGDKIYIYRGASKTNLEYYKWEEIVEPLIKEFGENKILFTDNKQIDDLMENYYNKCFVYVKPNPKGGCTSMFELGMMGRRTLGIGHIGLENFTEYKNIDDLIRLINIESKYIGQVREEVSIQTANCFVGQEWLQLDFWKN